MIPIKLSIQGLYSYQDIQEVDFKRLIDANIFGIFGKVGSGKTSLLEAISFALFGETERLNSRDNRQYNMMNLKSKELKIDFEFQAGSDHRHYKFIYEAKRHPKKYHEITTSERRMFVWQDNEWLPIGNEKEDVALLSKQIIGLDYDNFKRTIIIPQNQFREFLELSPRERTEMMNRLFKLDQYDLSSRVSKLNKTNDEQLSELRGLLSPLENATPEAIEQAQQAITAIVTLLANKDAEIKQLEPSEKQLLDSQTRSKSLTSKKLDLETLLNQADTYRQLERSVTLYELCVLIFQADLANLTNLQEKRNKLIDRERNVRQQRSDITKQLSSLTSLYDATKKAYESRDELKQKIDELDTVQLIRTIQQTSDLQQRNYLTFSKQLAEKVNLLNQCKTERNEQQTLVNDTLGKPSNLEKLYQIQNWFATYKRLKEQADERQQAINKYDQTIEQLKQRKTVALTGFPSEWTELTLKTLPEKIEEALAQLRTIRQEREEKHRQTLVQDELRKYANALHDGEPCPLCGSTHHPNQHVVNVDSANVQRSEAALQKVNQRIDETTALQLTINELVTLLRSEVDNGKRLIDERGKTIRQLAEHDDAFIWPEFSKTQQNQVEQAIKQERDNQEKLRKAQEYLSNLVRKIDAIEKDYNTLSNQVAEVEKVISEQKGQLKTAVESLQHFRLDEVSSWRLDQIDNLRESLTTTYHETKQRFEDAEQQKNSTEKRLTSLDEQIQQILQQLTEVGEELETQQQRIDQHLAKNDLSLEYVRQVLSTTLDTAQEKRRIQDYNEKCGILKQQIETLEAELKAHPFDPIALEAIQKQLATLQAEKDHLNKEHGRATTVLATLEAQWKQKQEYQKRYDELTLRQQDLKKMDEMFRAQGFVNYVSSVYLKNLCESANERFFKLTNNQLRLELDDKNNFQVRDYLNGGEVRSVKTLSGGQMFQAALSLALALSDNIQHLTKAKQNLFFLDEGFGTLDKDSLQTVFKTLKSLRSENRVVGIISHVDELQQEVDTYIRTVASENGSQIIRSWEE